MSYKERIDELGGLAMKSWCDNALKALDIARELLRENEQMKESMRAIQATIPSGRKWTHNELAHWVGEVEE